MRFGNTKLSEVALILMHQRGGRFQINNVGFFPLQVTSLMCRGPKVFFTFINFYQECLFHLISADSVREQGAGYFTWLSNPEVNAERPNNPPSVPAPNFIAP